MNRKIVKIDKSITRRDFTSLSILKRSFNSSINTERTVLNFPFPTIFQNSIHFSPLLFSTFSPNISPIPYPLTCAVAGTKRLYLRSDIVRGDKSLTARRVFAIARIPFLGSSAVQRRGVQQSTRPQREHCSETIKARSVTLRGRDGGRAGRKSLIRREHRLIGRVYERASAASRRSCKTSAISADNLWRLLFSRGPERKNRETERGGGAAREGREKERERADGW